MSLFPTSSVGSTALCLSKRHDPSHSWIIGCQTSTTVVVPATHRRRSFLPIPPQSFYGHQWRPAHRQPPFWSLAVTTPWERWTGPSMTPWVPLVCMMNRRSVFYLCVNSLCFCNICERTNMEHKRISNLIRCDSTSTFLTRSCKQARNSSSTCKPNMNSNVGTVLCFPLVCFIHYSWVIRQ